MGLKLKHLASDGDLIYLPGPYAPWKMEIPPPRRMTYSGSSFINHNVVLGSEFRNSKPFFFLRHIHQNRCCETKNDFFLRNSLQKWRCETIFWGEIRSKRQCWLFRIYFEIFLQAWSCETRRHFFLGWFFGDAEVWFFFLAKFRSTLEVRNSNVFIWGGKSLNMICWQLVPWQISIASPRNHCNHYAKWCRQSNFSEHFWNWPPQNLHHAVAAQWGQGTFGKFHPQNLQRCAAKIVKQK